MKNVKHYKTVSSFTFDLQLLAKQMSKEILRHKMNYLQPTTTKINGDFRIHSTHDLEDQVILLFHYP